MRTKTLLVAGLSIFLLAGCGKQSTYHKVRLTSAECQLVQQAAPPSTTDSVVNSAIGAVGGYFLGGLLSSSAATAGAALGGATGYASGGTSAKYACRLEFFHGGSRVVKVDVGEQFYMVDQVLTLSDYELQTLKGV